MAAASLCSSSRSLWRYRLVKRWLLPPDRRAATVVPDKPPIAIRVDDLEHRKRPVPVEAPRRAEQRPVPGAMHLAKGDRVALKDAIRLRSSGEGCAVSHHEPDVVQDLLHQLGRQASDRELGVLVCTRDTD